MRKSINLRLDQPNIYWLKLRAVKIGTTVANVINKVIDDAREREGLENESRRV